MRKRRKLRRWTGTFERKIRTFDNDTTYKSKLETRGTERENKKNRKERKKVYVLEYSLTTCIEYLFLFYLFDYGQPTIARYSSKIRDSIE